MNNKIQEMLKIDTAIAVLEARPIPSVVIKGRSLKYSNPAAIKEEYFINNGRSSFTPFRQAYGKINTLFGTSDIHSVPTVRGNRLAVSYGREYDILLFFPRYAMDIIDALECNCDLTKDTLAYIINIVLSGDTDLMDVCGMILTRLNHYDSYVPYKNLIRLIEQIILRITREEIFNKTTEYPDVYLERSDVYEIISFLVDHIASTQTGEVKCELVNGSVTLYFDGISFFSKPVYQCNVMVTRPFLTTERDLIASSMLSFASEMFYYKF